jgi:hypothetical protein
VPGIHEFPAEIKDVDGRDCLREAAVQVKIFVPWSFASTKAGKPNHDKDCLSVIRPL